MTHKKHVLMLGAGFMQKPAIESAKNLGWHVTAVDGNPFAVCASLAHSFKTVDLKDIPALEHCATHLQKHGGLDAVFTAGTDFSASVAYLAQKFSLPGHTYDAALNATDKVRMRKCFADHRVPSPFSAEFDSEKNTHLEKALASQKSASLPAVIKEFVGFFTDFPLVVKPVDNMGARGCRSIFSANELVAAIQSAIAYSRTGRAIVEEFMDGPEFSVDALVCGKKIIVCGFADRHIYYPPYFIEMGHTMSAENPESERNALLRAFEQGVHALGLTHGAAKGDLKLTSKGAMIGEIAARLSGGYMSGWTFSLASDLNLTEQALLLAAGEDAPLFSNNPPVTMQKISETLYCVVPANFSAERAWVSIPGTAQSITGYTEAENVSGVAHIFPRTKVGEKVVFPVNNVEKCGNIISRATTRKEAIKAAEEAARQIIIRLEPHNAATEAFLAQETEFPPSAYVLSAADKKKLNQMAVQEKIDFSKPLETQLPDFLQKYGDNLVDWNRKTLKCALEQFSKQSSKQSPISAAVFWRALIRGGLQGALYCIDCEQAQP